MAKHDGGTQLPVQRMTVSVVERDPAVRDGLRSLLSTLDVQVNVFDCAEAFLEGLKEQTTPVCVITAVDLPRLSGLDLLDQLAERGLRIPTIMLADHSDVPMAVRAMRAGAIDFIEKPFVDRLLLNRVMKVLHERR